MTSFQDNTDWQALTERIKQWGIDLGLDAVGITDTDLSLAEQQLNTWLSSENHGEMAYMAQHGSKRSRPAELLPGTISVISARLDYLPESQQLSEQVLRNPQQAFVSRYTLGRDYHKVLRKRLQRLSDRISKEICGGNYRVFVDSAPV
ncbi:MAG: DUF1730 domain-containing protein, partial [Candidatus Thiodiazotropha sp. (ex Notomyrtea botanica)]|nr:DUF1730 domain-containing protein [Candidatus Thiodiazotropha sp. (ex Notomyrtea botanica)]